MSWQPRDKPAFAHALLAKLPLGEIWPRTLGSATVDIISALAGVVARWARRTGYFLLFEAFPPTAAHLLPEWERVLGLPEPCFPQAQSLEERRLQVREKLARRPGGASRSYFIGIAVRLGYHHPGPGESDLAVSVAVQLGQLEQIRIREHRPFMAGMSRCGDPRWQVGPPELRFLWTVRVPGKRLTWFRAGLSRAGTEPHLSIRRAEDLECVFRKLKPAHTNVIFDYSGGFA